VLSCLKHLYKNYLEHFIDKETSNLSFKYPSLLVQRLLSFFAPDLSNHFKEIQFFHTCYIVGWIMTLFSHTIPTEDVVNIWTELLCEKVEFLFFITVAILEHLKDKLLLLDFNNTLQIINNISGLIDLKAVLQRAKQLQSFTPQSFIASDFTFKQSNQDYEMLKQNEYFAQRWWELEQLDYNEEYEVCLISAEDALNMAKNRVYIDVRDF